VTGALLGVGLGACSFDTAALVSLDGGPVTADAIVPPRDGPVELPEGGVPDGAVPPDGADAAVVPADGAEADAGSAEDGAAGDGPADVAAGCGAAGQSCCAGEVCDAALTCLGGVCTCASQLDGVAYPTSHSDSIGVALTTSNPNDLLYVAAVLGAAQSVRSISSTPSLTWTPRAAITFNGGIDRLVAYAAIWPDSGYISITLPLDNGASHWAAVAFGLSCVDVASPFDGDAQIATGDTLSPGVSFVPTRDNEFLIGVLGVGPTPPVTPGSGFTLIASAIGNAREVAAEYLPMPAAGSAVWVDYSLSLAGGWGIVADAVRAP